MANIYFKNGDTFTSILDIVYPVGSVYITTDSASPADIVGGTWTRINNNATLAQGTSDIIKTYSTSSSNMFFDDNLEHCVGTVFDRVGNSRQLCYLGNVYAKETDDKLSFIFRAVDGYDIPNPNNNSSQISDGDELAYIRKYGGALIQIEQLIIKYFIFIDKNTNEEFYKKLVSSDTEFGIIQLSDDTDKYYTYTDTQLSNNTFSREYGSSYSITIESSERTTIQQNGEEISVTDYKNRLGIREEYFKGYHGGSASVHANLAYLKNSNPTWTSSYNFFVNIYYRTA